MASTRIEAEQLSLLGYSIESGSFASGNGLIALIDGSGTASGNFSGTAGTYDVVIGYYDESDGVGQLAVTVAGSPVDSWNLDKNLGDTRASSKTFVKRTVASGITLGQGTSFSIQGTPDAEQRERVRIDYIEFVPIASPTPTPAPAPAPTPAPAPAPAPTPPPAPASTLRIEAENMTRSGYSVESGSFASGGKFIRVDSTTGTATTSFSGVSGTYNVIVGYYDENDGVSQLSVSIGGNQVDSWSLNQELGNSRASSQTFVRRTVASEITLAQGTSIQIQGNLIGGEASRVDYIEFVPVASPTPAPTPTPTAGDYSQASNGAIADLSKELGLAPIFGTAANPKIMPLGDSITSGQHSVGAVPGAYRIGLWEDFTNDGLSIDFVGSQSNGPSNLGDKNHEGRSGWTINQLTGLVDNGLLNTHQPNVLLLMAGTNDASTDTVSVMLSDISTLIDKISSKSPNTQIVVSSIAPINGSVKGTTRAQRAKDFNAQLPGLISNKAATGKKVSFVNAGGSLSLSDINSDGLHPTASGYDKLGDAWYQGLVKRTSLSGVQNLTGSAYDDILIGNAGANRIEGGAGDDLLTGGGSTDTLVYRSGGHGGDTITDFSSNDLFQISASGFGGGLVSGVGLSAETASSTGVLVQGSSAVGSSANFLYYGGSLYFDIDGVGAQVAVKIAGLTGAPALTVDQFSIVA